MRFVQKSTRFGAGECRKRLNDQHLQRHHVTKPKSFVTKVGTPAQKQKISLALLRGCKPSKARKPGKAEDEDDRTVDCRTVDAGSELRAGDSCHTEMKNSQLAAIEIDPDKFDKLEELEALN